MGKSSRSVLKHFAAITGYVLFIGLFTLFYQNCSKGIVDFKKLEGGGDISSFAPNLQILKHPLNRAAYTTNSVTLDVLVETNNNVKEVSYRWLKKGVAINGATNSSLTLNNITSEDGGDYSVEITAKGPLSETVKVSNVGTLSVTSRPGSEEVPQIIVGGSKSEIVNLGSPHVLHVINRGNPQPSVNWYKGSSTTPINLDKDYVLINGLTVNDLGYYRAEVTNRQGGVSTTLITISDSNVSPKFVDNTTETYNMAAGNDIQLKGTAYGFPDPSYKWFQKDANNNFLEVSPGGNFSINNDRLDISNIASTGAMEEFKLEISSSSGTNSKLFNIVVSNDFDISYSGDYPNNFPNGNREIKVKNGTRVDLTVNASLKVGNGSVDVQWYFQKAGELNYVSKSLTANTLTLNSVQVADAGNYKAKIVANNGDSTETTPVALNVHIPPQINKDLARNTTKKEMDTADLFVEFNPEASPPISCQWKKNNSNFGSSKTAIGNRCELSIQNLSNSDEADYKVVVSGDTGSDTSATTTLEVIVPPKIMNISAVPSIVDAGGSTSLTVELDANSEGPFDFSWLRNGQAFDNACSGSNSKTCSINISNLDEVSHDGSYSVLVTENVLQSSDTSNSVDINFNPVISEHPDINGATLNIIQGDTVTLNLTLSNPRNRNYNVQWYKNGTTAVANGSNGGATISGATTNALTISNINDTFVGAYSAEIIDNDNSSLKSTTRAVNLSVLGIPVVSFAQSTYTVDLNSSSNLIVNPTVDNYSGGISYTWSKSDGAIISNSKDLNISVSYLGYNGEVLKLSAKADNHPTAGVGTINVVILPRDLSFNVPNSVSANEGSDASFEATNISGGSENSSNYSYKWFSNDGATEITGETGTIYNKLAVASVEDGAKFKFELTDNITNQSLLSPSIILNVNPAAPIDIFSPPTSLTVEEGQNATFTVGARDGLPPLSYQWIRDGSDVPGETSAFYTISSTSVASDNGAQIQVRVYDSVQSSTTTAVTLTVTPLAPPLSIVSNPSSQSLLEDQTASFSVSVNGGTGLIRYQWKKDGSNISGATNANYSISNIRKSTHEGSYSVVVSDDNGSLPETPGANLTINGYTDLAVTVNDDTVNIPGTTDATFVASASGGTGAYDYQWYEVDTTKNPVTQTPVGSNSVSYTVSGITDLSKNGFQYQVMVTDKNSPATAAVNNYGTLTVNNQVLPLSIDTHPVSQTLQENQSVSFSVAASGGSGLITYQWKLNGATINGETNSTLTINNLRQSTHAGSYTVDVGDGSASISSNPATLTVNGYSLQIDTPVANATVDLGLGQSSATFTVVVSQGTGSYNFVWYEDDGDGNRNQVASGSNNSYSVTGVDISKDGYAYEVEVTDVNSPATQMVASSGTLSVVAASVNPPLTASISPTSKTVDLASEDQATFVATAGGGSSSPNYQYQWVEINSGGGRTTLSETSNTLVVSVADLSKDGYQYEVTITDGNDSSLTGANASASLAVVDTSVAANCPLIGTYEVDKNLYFEVLSNDGSGSGFLDYRWGGGDKNIIRNCPYSVSGTTININCGSLANYNLNINSNGDCKAIDGNLLLLGYKVFNFK